ncbi:MAG TPA: FAD-dependent oxidoreductase [Vicinamibacterales bacterium]|nr:FAD-dependent oxidoreductase [Vicinamibacterales bacterium]
MLPGPGTRRRFLQAAVAAPLAGVVSRGQPARRHVLVVGAGAFGGWTALYLLRRGARVTLVDAWGPGNSRASSGGETRIIRAIYGPDRPYVTLVARALQLWPEHQTRWNRPLMHRIGVLWMAGQDDSYERASIPLLESASLEIEQLMPAALARRYPQIDFSNVRWGLFEPAAGYLMARLACQAVLDAFIAEGGEYRQAFVTLDHAAGEVRSVRSRDGERLTADRFVLAAGPWLRTLLPEVFGQLIQPTRQEIFFFGTPAGDTRFEDGALPCWIDNGPRLFYGIPGNRWRGFKLADDARGPAFDPTDGDRQPSTAGIAAARRYMESRFPAMKGAPLLEARVCQYENSLDGHYIIDRIPSLQNAWAVGGGSGHGFKVGPALGELTAGLVLDDRRADPLFRFDRFGAKKPG